MFNRKLQVDVVKTKKTDKTPPTEDQSVSFERKVKIVTKACEGVAKKIVFGVCAYVVADTFRKVAIESVRR